MAGRYCPAMRHDLPPALVATLDRLARELTALRLEWCLFGGAALALHGLAPALPADVDVLTLPDGAQRLMQAFDLKNHADSSSERFRSDYLLRPGWGPLPIEIMAGFRIRQPSGWHPVTLPATATLQLAGQPLRVATRPALAALFRRCGRPKDMARAALLD